MNVNIVPKMTFYSFMNLKSSLFKNYSALREFTLSMQEFINERNKSDPKPWQTEIRRDRGQHPRVLGQFCLNVLYLFRPLS